MNEMQHAVSELTAKDAGNLSPALSHRKMPTKAERAEKKRQRIEALKQAELNLKKKRDELRESLKKLESKTISQAERASIRKAHAAVYCLLAKCCLEHLRRGDFDAQVFDRWMLDFTTREWDRKRYLESEVRGEILAKIGQGSMPKHLTEPVHQ